MTANLSSCKYIERIRKFWITKLAFILRTWWYWKKAKLFLPANVAIHNECIKMEKWMWNKAKCERHTSKYFRFTPVNTYTLTQNLTQHVLTISFLKEISKKAQSFQNLTYNFVSWSIQHDLDHGAGCLSKNEILLSMTQQTNDT